MMPKDVGQLKLPESGSKRTIFDSYRHAIEEMNFNSSMKAEDIYREGRKPGWLKIALVPIWAFVKAYILRGYIFHGLDGLVRSYIYAFARLMRVAKAREKFNQEAYAQRLRARHSKKV